MSSKNLLRLERALTNKIFKLDLTLVFLIQNFVVSFELFLRSVIFLEAEKFLKVFFVEKIVIFFAVLLISFGSNVVLLHIQLFDIYLLLLDYHLL